MDVWTLEEGLPVAHVTDIEFTADGFVWIATVEGLVRFDGAYFRLFGARDWPELRSNRLVDLAVSPADGALWILSDAGTAVSRLKDGQFQTWPRIGSSNKILEDSEGLWLPTEQGLYALTDKPERRWDFDGVNGTALGTDGSRWISLEKGGIWHIGTDGSTQKLAGVPDRISRFFPLIAGGFAWAAGPLPTDPAARWDGLRFVQLPGGEDPPDCSSTGEVLSQPCPPVHGERSPWRISRSGVSHAGRMLYTTARKARGAVVDPRGDCWLLTYGNGLRRLRPMREPVRDGKQEDGPTPPEALALSVDAEGRIWARGPDYQWTPGPEGPKRLWIDDPDPRRQGQVDAAYLLLEGEEFFAAHEGLLRLLPRPEGPWAVEVLWEEPRLGTVRASLRDRQGRLWLGGSGGLWVRQEGIWSEQLDGEGRGIPGVRAIVEHPAGGILLGVQGEGLRWLNAEGKLQRLDPGLRTDNPRHLRLDGDALWVGTEDAGLCRVAPLRSPEPVWRCAGDAEGLPANGAHVSVDDGLGHIWLSTNRGLSVSSRADLEAWARGEQSRVHFLRLDREAGVFSVEDNGGTDQATLRTAGGLSGRCKLGRRAPGPRPAAPAGGAPAPGAALDRSGGSPCRSGGLSCAPFRWTLDRNPRAEHHFSQPAAGALSGGGSGGFGGCVGPFSDPGGRAYRRLHREK
jgi:ligand-binding sensor domain-containing protein